MPAPPYLNAFRRSAGRTGRNLNRTMHQRTISGTSNNNSRQVLQPRYAFPSIPRPQRNPLYYYTASLKRGLSYLPQTRPISYVARRTSAGLKYLPSLRTKSGYRRISSSTQAKSKAGRRFLRWWTIPAVSVVLWGVFKRKQQQEAEQQDKRQQPAKPWQVAAYSTLPLKAMSRLWGRFNDITLPVWMREPGFKLYSYMFGVNLEEVEEQDLTKYANLGEFFYRNLKPGVRPIDDKASLVSPADGKVLHLGVISDQKVEQVKGITYRLDALLGGAHSSAPHHVVDFEHHNKDEIIERDKKFAVMNGIEYTLDELIGEGTKIKDRGDATAKQPKTSLASFRDLLSPDFTPDEEKELFFSVIYLAPGDYHRFHSPTNWVAELRRHFVGELYSVAPYFQRKLEGLFCLNERVALLGRWKYGFFSMTPVGATNVGSIKLNFDKDLKTNTSRSPRKPTCYEATYSNASKLLGGYPLNKGQQMGGFNLGSTVVLVFEAPKTFKFNVKAGDKVQVGQSLGQ